MALTKNDYLRQLQNLLPQGPAWPRESDSLITLILDFFAEEFSRVDSRIDDLINEADPRTTSELLIDWEHICGLPDGCTGALSSLSERRAAVVGRLTTEGGQSANYYIALAAKLGFSITITEQQVHNCISSCADPINGPVWRFVWDVNVAVANTVRQLSVVDGVNSPLATWGNALLECALSRLKPAHTLVRFVYP